MHFNLAELVRGHSLGLCLCLVQALRKHLSTSDYKKRAKNHAFSKSVLLIIILKFLISSKGMDFQ